MQIIGDPNIFAVQLEWDRDPTTHRPWMFGVFCVYFCGTLLGTPRIPGTLNGILASLDGWKEGLESWEPSAPELMSADRVTAFLSHEEVIYGLDHLQHMIPHDYKPIPFSSYPNQILSVDGLDHYKIYCIESETTSRLVYRRRGEMTIRDCRLPRVVLTDVLLQTIDTLDDWFQQLPVEPKA